MSDLTSNSPKHDWIVIFSGSNFPEAHLVAGRLKTSSIPAYVHGQPGMSAMGITIGLMGEIQVLVSPSDYDAAYDLLYPEEDAHLPDNTLDVRYIMDDEYDDSTDE